MVNLKTSAEERKSHLFGSTYPKYFLLFLYFLFQTGEPEDYDPGMALELPEELGLPELPAPIESQVGGAGRPFGPVTKSY